MAGARGGLYYLGAAVFFAGCYAKEWMDGRMQARPCVTEDGRVVR